MANAVSLTLGPGGRTIVIDPDHDPNPMSPEKQPLITKDGVTVSDNIREMTDMLESIGAKLINDAA